MQRDEAIKWFITVKEQANPKIRLFCFPYAGGGASIYREWNQNMPNEIEICAIQYPGRENRISENPIDDFDLLVTNICEAIQHKMDLPFALFGHSLGAKVAYEVAKRLESSNTIKPDMLFVSGARAPHFPVPNPIHHLDDSGFTKALARYQGTPVAILENEEIMQVFLPMIRADFVLDETFCSDMDSQIAIPIIIFAGNEDKIAFSKDVQLWEKYTTENSEFIEMPGQHFFLKTSQNDLLDRIKQRLLAILEK